MVVPVHQDSIHLGDLNFVAWGVGMPGRRQNGKVMENESQNWGITIKQLGYQPTVVDGIYKGNYRGLSSKSGMWSNQLTTINGMIPSCNLVTSGTGCSKPTTMERGIITMGWVGLEHELNNYYYNNCPYYTKLRFRLMGYLSCDWVGYDGIGGLFAQVWSQHGPETEGRDLIARSEKQLVDGQNP